jgi:expansin (peptidoglycan-binding protein)
LFESTFSQIASTAAGYLSVDWQLVDCGLSTPVQVSFKDGSDADWFSLQVRNHNKPIGKCEVSATGAGNWQALSRTGDNYFPKAGGVGSNTVDIRVTDVTGSSIAFEKVSVGSGVTFASSNF